MELYFDSNVYDFIGARNEARVVRKWLERTNHTLIASDEANVGEVLRIPDPHARASQVRTIMLRLPVADLLRQQFLGPVGRGAAQPARSRPATAPVFIGDGNLGLWAAQGEVYPEARRQSASLCRTPLCVNSIRRPRSTPGVNLRGGRNGQSCRPQAAGRRPGRRRGSADRGPGAGGRGDSGRGTP